MVDIHDRRPLVLSPEQAREWLDPDLSPAQAEEIARDRSRPEADFEWYAVGKEVGNVKNQGAQLLLPWRSEED
jgi:putative SOS response-associated peptidase YedK